MQTYILRRLAIIPPFLLAVSIVTFLVVRWLPGDAALVNTGLGNAGCVTCRQAIRAQLGLDKPLPEQYWIWLKGAIHGDFGNSTTNKRTIAPEIRSRFWNTLQITALAMLLTVLLGIPLGTISALYRNSPLDYGARFAAIIGLSIPNFWLATLIVLLPALWWGWTPARSWVGWNDPGTHLQLLLLPACVLAASGAAVVARIVRSSMIEELASDYVRTALSKGLGQSRVVWAHVLRNAMLPLLTILGLQAGVMLGGAVVVESIFSVPGVGLMASQAVVARDFQTLQALTVLFAAWFILIQLAVDVAYVVVDPRVQA